MIRHSNEPGESPAIAHDAAWVVGHLEQALDESGSNRRILRLLRQLASEDMDLFFSLSMEVLGTNEDDSTAHRLLIELLIQNDSFFEPFLQSTCRSWDTAIRLFQRFLMVDPTLDFRLARMLPGRNDSGGPNVLKGAAAARAIEILDRVSPGQRLMSVLGHLPNSSDPQIAAKAALFVGRRKDSPEWTAKQLNCEDDRHRANALEGAWGAKSKALIDLLEECAADANNRVAGNALVGLHLAGHPEAVERTLDLSESSQQRRRSTAAWAMGKIASPVFIDRLTALIRDDHAEVRSAAIRSLVQIGRAETKRQAQIAADLAKKVAVVAPEPPAEEPAAPAAPEEPLLIDIRLDGSSFNARKRP